MKIEINIDESEVESIIQETGKKRSDVHEALEEYFHIVIEDQSDEREEHVLSFLDDIVEDDED
jgi:tRNA splicing ligase